MSDHGSTAQINRGGRDGVEVSTDSATEATRDSIADTKLEVAVPPVSHLERAVAEHTGQGLPS
jgi:hypothetical protein